MESTSNNQAFAQALALAEQHTPEMGDQGGIATDIHPTTGITATPKADYVTKTIQLIKRSHQIQITDDWFDLPIWHARQGLGELPVADSNKCYTLREIPINYLLGIFDHNEYDGTGSIYQPIGSDDIGNCTHVKLLDCKIELKNFVLTVERDTSGGVQIVDPVTFQLQWGALATQGSWNPTYIENKGNEVLGTNLYYTTNEISDLKKGLTFHTTFNQPQYYSARQLWGYSFKSEQPPAKYFWYPNIGQLISWPDTGVLFFTLNGVTYTQETIEGPYGNKTWCPNQFQHVKARVLNWRSFTNVKLHLSYECHLTSHVNVFGTYMNNIRTADFPAGHSVFPMPNLIDTGAPKVQEANENQPHREQGQEGESLRKRPRPLHRQ